MQFIEYRMTDIDAGGKNGRITADVLSSLRRTGKARLLYAPKVLTNSGEQATVKAVREVIYPTQFAVWGGNTNTNMVATASAPSVEPGGFETREAGVLLTVLPEMADGGSMICLTLTPGVVDEPDWKDYGGKYVDAKGKEQEAKMEMPFFHTQSLTTSISVKDGATVLLGGGMPCKDPAKVVYAFVTARRVGLDGTPLRAPPAPSK